MAVTSRSTAWAVDFVWQIPTNSPRSDSANSIAEARHQKWIVEASTRLVEKIEAVMTAPDQLAAMMGLAAPSCPQRVALPAQHVAGIDQRRQVIAIRLALPPAAVVLIEVETSSTSQSRRYPAPDD
jgi:hypothetical protein